MPSCSYSVVDCDDLSHCTNELKSGRVSISDFSDELLNNLELAVERISATTAMPTNESLRDADGSEFGLEDL